MLHVAVMKTTDDDEPLQFEPIATAIAKLVTNLSVTPDREQNGDERRGHDGEQHIGKSDCDNRLLDRLRNRNAVDCAVHV